MEAQTIDVAALAAAAFAESVERLARSAGFVTRARASASLCRWTERSARLLLDGSRRRTRAAPFFSSSRPFATTSPEQPSSISIRSEQASSRQGFESADRSGLSPRRRRPALMQGWNDARPKRPLALTLDAAGSAAEALYRSLVYSLAGAIPNAARNAFEERYDACGLCTRTCVTDSLVSSALSERCRSSCPAEHRLMSERRSLFGRIPPPAFDRLCAGDNSS